MATNSVSRKREVITGPYTEVSALIRPKARKGDNQAGQNKGVKTFVAYAAGVGGGLTTRLDKVTRVDGKLRAKLDNKKKANFDFSANSKEGSTTWPDIGAKDDKEHKDETKYLVARPDKSVKDAGCPKNERKCLKSGLETIIRDVNRYGKVGPGKEPLLSSGLDYGLVILVLYLFSMVKHN